MQLGNHRIIDGAPPYVIAEIGVNHEGSMEKAKQLIDLAKAGGAQCAKFQTYKADSLACRNSPTYWDTNEEPTKSQHALFAKHDSFGLSEYQSLAAYCRTVGIEFLSTPFDLEAVEWLDPLVHFFKIASADLTNTPLLRHVAATRKPVLLSTGASTLPEIEAAIGLLETAGTRDIVLLHCVLAYPCPHGDANLDMIAQLRRVFPGRTVGFSDHTTPDPGMRVLLAAWLKGAQVIEKHFTNDKSLPGNDHYHAMDIDDLARFIADVEFVAGLGGDGYKRVLAIEEPARLHARRSIVAARAICPGEVLSTENLTTKRPGHGLSPILWDEILGRHARREIADDKPLVWADIE